ncbi:MAG: hypothetical protein NTX56_04305 [Proteobacteria bacterium]|nr:hypothetical protein [Pseudomonadota bacterium]
MTQIKLSREDMMNAIRMGVADGIFRIATNATDTPCEDFFGSIKDGVREAIIHLDPDAI